MKLFYSLLFFSISLNFVGQNVNIPDVNLKNALVTNSAINLNQDSEIQLSEAIAFNGTIQISDEQISNLQGLEAFINVTKLYCHYNDITNLNLEKNTKLIEVGASNNKITAVDVTKNVDLKVLGLDDNKLNSLNIANNLALTELYVDANSLSTIDLSKNINLGTLSIRGNSLASLDISLNTLLVTISCSENMLTSIDVSKCPSLKVLNVSSNTISTIDVSLNTSLNELSADDNSLTTLDVTKNTLLEMLFVRNNQIETLDLTKNTKLFQVFAHNNKIKALDISNSPNMGEFTCNNNALTSLNVANGNNESMYVNSINNPNLSCIQVDAGFTPSGWERDVVASYSDSCATASIDDNVIENQVSLYPNPFDDIISIKNISNHSTPQIEIYNSIGKKVLSTKKKEIELSHLISGIYFAKMYLENSFIIKKLIKK